MNDERIILEGQIRECYGRVVYSHKTHEKCADILIRKHDCIKIWQMIISALVTGGIVSTFFDKGHIGSIVSVFLSTILLILNTYTKNYDFGELAQKHRQAGSDLWIIREKYLSLLTDIRIGDIPLDSIRARRDNLIVELHTIYSGSPSTNYKAYTAAQEALKKFEDMTFSDDEIDAFLPKELKRN
ncbi:SLATT domain-containing protein [Pectobacterium brasiliense]|uniref:SLATT domain-containing protein n=1 Tax=Pectobacterium brasiliense TaxID=180957 RepID=UPI001968D812|nr:SLATT domain-containing protein [Pectobacterium brasiliense]MBN3124379.1 SLATT domain-containing protein [Pectobacterium brasiliense]